MAQMTPVEQTGKRLVFEDSIELAAPMQDVYQRWSDFTRFPDFMSNVEQVQAVGENRYHWVARIFGIKQEWDAEVTDRTPQSHLSWRSLNGAYNAGTVTFHDLGNGATQVRLRLEYSPPAGQVGQALDSITRTTQREVHQDLENFRRVVSGQGSMLEEMEPSTYTDMQRILGSLATVVTFGAAGGTVAHYVLENVVWFKPVKNPSSILSAPATYLAGKAIGVVRPPMPFSTGQSIQSKIASYAWATISGGAILAAATLRMMNRRSDALFVGQWAPTALTLATLSRLIGDNGIKTPLLARKASWAFSSASLGAILCSLFWQVRGYRKDGLFVGQWAPTLMLAAALARVYRDF